MLLYIRPQSPYVQTSDVFLFYRHFAACPTDALKQRESCTVFILSSGGWVWCCTHLSERQPAAAEVFHNLLYIQLLCSHVLEAKYNQSSQPFRPTALLKCFRRVELKGRGIIVSSGRKASLKVEVPKWTQKTPHVFRGVSWVPSAISVYMQLPGAPPSCSRRHSSSFLPARPADVPHFFCSACHDVLIWFLVLLCNICKLKWSKVPKKKKNNAQGKVKLQHCENKCNLSTFTSIQYLVLATVQYIERAVVHFVQQLVSNHMWRMCSTLSICQTVSTFNFQISLYKQRLTVYSYLKYIE